MKNKGWHLFLLRVLLFMVIAYAVAFLADWAVRKRLSYQKYNKVKWINDFQNQSFDLVFLGTSRAETGLDPEVVSQRLGGKNVLNIGLMASSVMDQYICLKMLCDKNRVKKVLFVVDPANFIKSDGESQFLFHPFHPYFFIDYLDNEAVKSSIINKYGFVRYCLWRYIPLYMIVNFKQELSVINDTRVFDQKGFTAYRPVMDSSVITSFESSINPMQNKFDQDPTIKIDTLQFSYLQKIFDIGKHTGIQIIAATLPYYALLNKLLRHIRVNAEAQIILTKTLHNSGIVYLDFHDEKFDISDRTMFSDPAHFNKSGAQYISNLVCDSLIPSGLAD